MNRAASGPDGHLHYLDWLRVLAIIGVLFFHTGMIFVGWGWHIESRTPLAWLDIPMDMAHRLRMPLLFVIAGAGTYLALGRRSGASYVRERGLRLFLPLVFGMFVIVPPQIWWELRFRGRFDGGYLDFYPSVFEFVAYPAGRFSWHHLWFVLYLFLYSLCLLPLFLLWRERAAPCLGRVFATPWVYALALPLALNEWLLKPAFPERHDLVHDWYLHGLYAQLFLFGFGLARTPGALERLAAWRGRSLGMAMAMVPLFFLLEPLGYICFPLEALMASVLTWFGILGFLGYGRRYLNVGNRFLAWAREASYPFYILHQTVIVGVGFQVLQTDWPAPAQFLAILLVSGALSVAIYELAVRRIVPLRLAFGMKARTAAPGARSAGGEEGQTGEGWLRLPKES